jgi:hypothetical protein
MLAVNALSLAAVAEQIVAREPRERVSHEALLVHRCRYRAAALTQPFGAYF